MFEWKIKVGKYGNGTWYTPFISVGIHPQRASGVAFVFLHWQFVIMRVPTEAYWKAAFEQNRDQSEERA